MSALGHKRTYALQKGMSALPPIATEKADIERGGVGALRVPMGPLFSVTGAKKRPHPRFTKGA